MLIPRKNHVNLVLLLATVLLYPGVHCLSLLKMEPSATRADEGNTMFSQTSKATRLARQLIRIESITPNDNGCQAVVQEHLEKLGFACETLNYHEVTNLWAVKGSNNKKPFVIFAGHTDVVPPGPLEKWTYPPFEGALVDGILFGRGAVDMKGGIASFLVGLESFLSKCPDHEGSVGVLLTSNEEGEAIYGTKEVVSELTRRGTVIDMCIVGEPSSTEKTGDIIKVGRRGSLGGELTIHGIQGHVAYPHLSRNPIHESLGALRDMVDTQWDQGTEDFDPTTFQISNISSGTGAANIVPGFKTVVFNFRYSPASTEQQLKDRVKAILDGHALNYDLYWTDSSKPYETPRDSELVQAALASAMEVTGSESKACTSGGTSDGRFLSAVGAQVIEVGPINKTIHKINEHVATADLDVLAKLYENLLFRLLCKRHSNAQEHNVNDE